MDIGYRVIRPEDAFTQDLPLVQISLWREAHWGIADGERAVSEAIRMAKACRLRGIRSVFHPLEYPITNELGDLSMNVFRRLAQFADLGLIIHDEGGRGRRRLQDADARLFERRLAEISGLCPVSIENSYDSTDIRWFWERFVLPADDSVSITLDIGHLESAGIDASAFVRGLPQPMIDRIAFVHMHHKGGDRGGVVDHWPLVPGCREIEALRLLHDRKGDLRVILELDAGEKGISESVRLLKEL